MITSSTRAARRLFPALFVAISCGLAGCAATQPATTAPTPQEPPPPAPEPRSQADVAPRLVVLIVVDQLGTWVLEQHLELLPERGAIRRAHREGAVHVLEYPYASTQTAPGHASLTTGVTPAVHGIVANAIYDSELGTRRTIDDREHAVLGNPERFASPRLLRSESVADVLHRETNGEARIVGISMKPRSAVLSVGQQGALAVFYDAKARGMTTSTYYVPRRSLPDWVQDFNRANPVERLLQPWQPSDPASLSRVLGPDAQPGELYPEFPHDPRDAPDPWSAFASTPESSEYLLAAAYAAVKAERMGLDDVPDLLVIGVSGTDIIGHLWGARSWEFADNLARVDRAITHLGKLLEARGPVAFVLTSDHGVAEMPEQAGQSDGTGGRLNPKHLVAEAEKAADAALGPGDWIAGYVPPLFTYTAAGKIHHSTLTETLKRTLPALPGVRSVYDAHDGVELRRSRDEIERLVGQSLPTNPPGDLYMVAEPGWFDSLSDLGGTNHGSPWEYDRQVPVLMWGAAIERRVSEDPRNALQLAATLAALLGIPSPREAAEGPLPGVMRLPD